MSCTQDFPIKVLGGLVGLSVGVLVGCAQSNIVRNSADNVDQGRGEYSIKADRSQLANMRQNVPQDIQERNDEWALVLNLMVEGKEHPSKVRQKFSDLSRKVRRHFDRDHRRVRDEFNRAQKQARQDFTKRQERERREFQGQKPDRDANQSFYNRQNRERLDFYADLTTAQREFEADQRQKQRDFDAYIREKQSHFDQEYREYSRQYNERQNTKNIQTNSQSRNGQVPYQDSDLKRGTDSGYPSGEDNKALQEFENFPTYPGTPL